MSLSISNHWNGEEMQLLYPANTDGINHGTGVSVQKSSKKSTRKGTSVPTQLSGGHNTITEENSGLRLVREKADDKPATTSTTAAHPKQSEIAQLKYHENLISQGRFKTALDYQRRIDIICNNEYGAAKHCRLVLPLLEQKLQEFPEEEVMEAKNPQRRELERQNRVATKTVLNILVDELNDNSGVLDDRDKRDDVFADIYGWGKELAGGDTSENLRDEIGGKRAKIQKTFHPMLNCSHEEFKTKFKEKTGYSYNDYTVQKFMKVHNNYINYLSWTEAANELKENYLNLPQNQESLELLEEKLGGIDKIKARHKNYDKLSTEKKCELLNGEVKKTLAVMNEQRRIVLVNSGCLDTDAKGEAALKGGFEELRASYKNSHASILDMVGVDDISRRVEEYCIDQEKGGNYVKTGAKFAAAIGLTIATAGYGSIAVGAAISASNFAIDVTSLATNDIDGDINFETLGDIGVDALVDGATTAAGFKVGTFLAGRTFSWAGKYANVTRYGSGFSGDIGLGMLNEVYHNPDHTITLTGTLVGTAFAAAGNAGLLRSFKNTADVPTHTAAKAKNIDIDPKVLKSSIHSAGKDMDGMIGSIGASRQSHQIAKDLEKLGLDEVYSFDVGQLHAGGARFAVTKNADGTFNIANITRGDVHGISIAAAAKTKTHKLKNGKLTLGAGIYNIDIAGTNRPLRLNIGQDLSNMHYSHGMSYEKMVNAQIAALPPNTPYKINLGKNIDITVVKDTNGNITLSHNAKGKTAIIEEFPPSYSLENGVNNLKPGSYDLTVLDAGTMKIRIPGQEAALTGGAKVAGGKSTAQSNFEQIVNGQFAGVPEKQAYYFPVGKTTIGVIKDGDGTVQIACAKGKDVKVKDVTEGETNTFFTINEEGTALTFGRTYEIEVAGEGTFTFTPTHASKAATSAPKTPNTNAGVHAESAPSASAKTVELDSFSANIANRLEKTKPNKTCTFEFEGINICLLKDFDGRITVCQVGEQNVILKSISRENARPQNLNKTSVELSGDSYYSITLQNGRSFTIKTPKIEGDAVGVAQWEKSTFRARPQEARQTDNPTAESPTGEAPNTENPTHVAADAPTPPVAPTAEDFGRATSNMTDDMLRGSDMISEFLEKNLKNNSAQSFDVAPGVKLEFEKVDGQLRIRCTSEAEVYTRNANRPNAEITKMNEADFIEPRVGCTYDILLPNGQMLKIKIPVDIPNPNAGAKAASESADNAAKGKAPETEPQSEWDNVQIDFSKPTVIDSRARLSDAIAKRSEFDADMVALDARIKNGDIPTMVELRGLRKKFGMYCTNMSTPEPAQLKMYMEKVGLSEISPENILKARTKFADNKEILDALDEIESAWKSELASQPFMYLNGYIDYRRAAESAQRNGQSVPPWNQVYDPTQKSANVY